MFEGKSVSVVISTYREKMSIRQCVDDFFATGVVDEVVVVDNNSEEGTVDEIKKTKAVLIHETNQGYGYGYQTGLKHAKSDLIVMCEGDGTFLADDILKFLIYSKEVQLVQGSRTCSTMILSGANMGIALKYGNYLVAKIAEFLFFSSAPHLSDCGCTYRLLSREAYEQIKPYFRENHSAFGFELSLLALRAGISMVEVPIRYQKRIGKSSVTGSMYKTFTLGSYMFFLCFYHLFQNLFTYNISKHVDKQVNKQVAYEK
ncbi:MAG: glycosyltransferase family 2 protein [Oligoflexia bacterium]|nr:glycosyltransferase family 2 protein [Oligoflexia bacterium]